MTTFSIGDENYEVTRTLTRDDGTYVVCATQTNHTFPTNLAWRADVMVLRYKDGSWRWNSWNMGLTLADRHSANVEAAAKEFERLEALKAQPQANPVAPIIEDTPQPEQFDWQNPAVQQLIRAVATKNIAKIEPSHIVASAKLLEIAHYYTRCYEGNFEFMLNMATALVRWQSLTPGQAAGVLNCLLAEYRRNQQAPKPPIKSIIEDLPANLPEVTYNPLTNEVTPKDLPQGQYSANIVMPEGDTLAPNGLRVVTPVVHNGTYTIVLNEKGDYRTLRIVDAPEQMGKPQGTQIAQFLSGADNTADFTGFAFVSGSRVGIWSKFKADSVLAKALNILLTADKEQQADYGQAYAIESNNCWRCGRKLTVPASVNRGLGPICAEKLGY